MTDFQKQLDHYDSLQQKYRKAVDDGDYASAGILNRKVESYGAYLAPRLARALEAVVESCEETIRSVDKNLLPDEGDHAKRHHADMVLDAITDAMEGDDA